MNIVDAMEGHKTIRYWADVILNAVGLSIVELKSNKKTRTICNKRKIVYYFLRELCGYSWVEIGDYCDRTHSNIVKVVQFNKKEIENTLLNKLIELKNNN